MMTGIPVQRIAEQESNKLVCMGEFEIRGRWDVQLFGEQQSRIVISVKEDDVAEVMRLGIDYQVEVLNLGKVGGERLFVPGLLDVSVADISDAWMVGV